MTQPARILTEEELRSLSGYTKRSALRRWAEEAGFQLLPDGKGGRVSAIVPGDKAANDDEEIEFA